MAVYARLRGGNPVMWALTPDSAVVGGDVVVDDGGSTRVYHHDYDPADDNATETPQAAIRGGVYELDKDGTSGPTFDVGDPVYWHATNGATSTTTDDHFGFAVEAAGTNEATVIAEHNPIHGTFAT